MKKLHVWLMTVLVVVVALVMAVALTGCGSTETPDGGETGGSGNGGSGAPATQSKGLDFEKIEDTETYAVVGLGNCKDSKVVIPATYKNKPVTTIMATAFVEKCESITEIYVPDSVKTIESGAFGGCTALQKLTIPVLKNRLNAYFSNGVPTTLKTVILTTMTEVPKYAFSGCTSLEEVEFPTNATEIGWACLEGCKNIKKLTTPFVGTTNVYYFDSTYQRTREAKNNFVCNNISIKGGNRYDAHLYNYWGVYVYLNGSYYFGTSVYAGNFEELIPTEIISLTITNGYITDRACWQSNVKNVVINGVSPNEAKGVGRFAFSGCDLLSSVTLSSEFMEIGRNAFYACTSLTSVTLPNGLTELRDEVFRNCSSLITVTMPSSMRSIGAQTFSGCASLTSIQIPSGVTCIGTAAFLACGNLNDVSIPSSITELGEALFSGCDKLSYNIYENGRYLGNSENPYVMLMDVENTSVSSFVIHNDTKHIYNSSFAGCNSLKNITIPASVKRIGKGAFEGCDSLASAIFERCSGWKIVKTETNWSASLSESEFTDTKKMAMYLRSYRNGSYGGYRDYDWYCE